MKTSPRTPSSKRLAEANPEAMEHYRRMRAVLLRHADVDAALSEVVLTVQFAVLGEETAFKVHAQRALTLGASKTQLRGVLMAGLGVTLVASATARALAWLDEAYASAGTSSSTDSDT